MADIKRYRSKGHSLSSGQVLMRGYSRSEGRLIVMEMTDRLTLQLAGEHLMAQTVSLWICYDRGTAPPTGRSLRLQSPTASPRLLMAALTRLYDQICLPDAPVRRVGICFQNVCPDSQVQLSLFDPEASVGLARDERLHFTAWEIRQRFGKEFLFRGMDLLEAATARERDIQIGGHKSGASRRTGQDLRAL